MRDLGVLQNNMQQITLVLLETEGQEQDLRIPKAGKPCLKPCSAVHTEIYHTKVYVWQGEIDVTIF